MLRISVACVSLALLAGACSSPETNEPADEPTAVETPQATPTSEVADNAEERLPPVDPETASASWKGSDLAATSLISTEIRGEEAILTRAEDGELVAGGITSGARVEYLAPASASFSEMAVTVTVTARAVTDPAPFSVSYSTNAIGNSGWQEFQASSEAVNYSFTYNIGSAVDTNSDFIGIAVPEGSSVAIQKVSVEVAPRTP